MPSRPPLGCALVVAFVGTSLVLQVLVGVVTAVWLLVFGASSAPLDPSAPLPVGAMGVLEWLQFALMIGAAAALVYGAKWPWRKAFAVAPPPPVSVGIAVTGGMLVGVWAGWVAQELMDYVPQINLGNLQMIDRLLVDGPLLPRLPLLVAVCVGAPLVEELVFRGFVFDATDRSLGPWAAWLLSSALFAAYHLDPVHVLSVFSIGLFLGWLRWTSRSVWPGVVAHAVNNTLAAVVTIASGGDIEQQRLAWPWAVAALAALLGLALLASRVGVGSSEEDGWASRSSG